MSETQYQPIIVRRWKKQFGQGLVALLPEDPSDCSGELCTAYEPVGGHGGANFELVFKRTVPCREVDDIVHLLGIMKSIGYKDLILFEKVTPNMNKRRYMNAAKYYAALLENPLPVKNLPA